MQRNLKLSISWTVVAAFIYAAYLFILSHYGKLPDEKELIIWSRNWSMELPFTVSYWWSLTLFPMLIILFCYVFSKDEIVGNYPKDGSTQDVKDKYSARHLTYFVSMVSLIAGMTICVFGTIFFPFIYPHIGILSNFATGIFVWAVCYYVILGPWMTTLTILMEIKDFDGFFCKRTLTEYYTSKIVKYIKIGFVRTFPLIIGTTIGYLIRSTNDWVIYRYDRIKDSFKKESVA